MNVEQIFANLQETETRLIKMLSQKDNLIFLGDDLTLSYLRNKIDLQEPNSDDYYYYCWSSPQDKIKLSGFLDGLNDLYQYKIVVASVKNENIIYDQVQESIRGKNIKVIKLFSDILVNILSHQEEICNTSEIKIVAPNLSYAIISGPRSGSTFLCNLLESTGLAGFPAEHLRHHVEILARNCCFDYLRYMQIVMTRKSSKNRVFGTKIISHFLPGYRRKDLNIDTFLNQHFSKYIFLIREDKVAQAVSIFIAQKTGIYHVFNESQKQEYNQQLEKIDLEEIDLKEINKRYKFVCQQDKYLEKFCQDNQIDPLIVKYEELVNNPQQYISDILTYLGINNHKIDLNIQTNIKKTKSQLSNKLIQKFKIKYNIN